MTKAQSISLIIHFPTRGQQRISAASLRMFWSVEENITSALSNHGASESTTIAEVHRAVRSFYSDSVRFLELFQHAYAFCRAGRCEKVKTNKQTKIFALLI